MGDLEGDPQIKVAGAICTALSVFGENRRTSLRPSAVET
jgi:hypothetical protein